jgi:hypothetical protein
MQVLRNGMALLFIAGVQVAAHATDVAYKGGAGGGEFRLACPANTFMHGVDLGSGAWIERIRAKCIPFDQSTQRFGGPAQFTAFAGNAGSPPPPPPPEQPQTECSDDMYVFGIKIGFTHNADGSAQYLDHIRLDCSNLAGTSADTKCVGTGQGCWASHPDGTANLSFQLLCPAGEEAANGLIGKSGRQVDALGLMCTRKPTLSPPPNEWLVEHNKHKGDHCLAEALYTWSVELENAARNWANGCHQLNGRFCHENNLECPGARGSPYGENLAWAGPVRDVAQPAQTPKEAVQAWYDEINNYNFSAPALKVQEPGVNGHFTQVVWKASRELGCAQATCEMQRIRYTLSVCKYKPTGNFSTVAALTENVLPPSCKK